MGLEQLLINNLGGIIIGLTTVSGTWAVYKAKQSYIEREIEDAKQELKAQNDKFTLLLDRTGSRNNEIIERITRVESKIDIFIQSMTMQFKNRE